MEEMEKGEKTRERETERGTTHPTAEPVNVLCLLHGLNSVLRVEYGGEMLPVGSSLILAIIQQENIKNGNYCTHDQILSRFGKNSRNGNYVSILEKHGLIIRPKLNAYSATTQGEILLKQISTELIRLLHNRPTKDKRKKARQPKRQRPPLETFEQLVNEVLNKAGLNQRVKYALLKTLGMTTAQAKAALKQLQPLKHTERIKPILKDMLYTLTNEVKP